MFVFRAALGCLLVATLSMVRAQQCALVVQEDRSERELAVLPIQGGQARSFVIAFEHSVLGTTVEDHYEWRATSKGFSAWLTQERFSGEGYGLPYQALESERLERVGTRWHLHTNRLVEPLVVRPLRPQKMRLVLNGVTFLLADFNSHNSEAAQRFTTRHC